jgi:hypothetical protein
MVVLSPLAAAAIAPPAYLKCESMPVINMAALRQAEGGKA